MYVFSKSVTPITPLMWSRHKFVCDILDSVYLADKTCLEIGCGTGDFLKILEKRLFYKIKAIDLSKENIEITKAKTRRADISRNNLFNIKEKFDVIIMLEVLEHIENDEEALSHIAKNLIDKNGLFLLVVPSHNVPMTLNFGHYRHYKKEELKQLLEKTGFKVSLFYSYGTKFIGNLGIQLLKKRYGKNFEKRRLTEESARVEFPFVWRRILYPLLSNFYFLFYLIDYYFLKNTDKGVDYLVLCKKRKGF